MKLKRGINYSELEELIRTTKVQPKRYSKIIFNNPGDIQLTLNILRSQLDFEDFLFAPHGYTINDIKYCTFKNFKGSIHDLWKILNK